MRLCIAGIAALAIGALSAGCVDNVPADGGVPVDSRPRSATALEFKMLIYHHPMLASSQSTAEPMSTTWQAATNVWRSQCSILLLHHSQSVRNIDGVNENEVQVKLGTRFAHQRANGTLLTHNWVAVRQYQVRKDQRVNRGADVYYTHAIYTHGGHSAGVTQFLTANRAVMLSSQSSSMANYQLILPHEIGHMLSLDHRQGAYLMDDWLGSWQTIPGKQPDGSFALNSDCQLARQSGYFNQLFLEPYQS